MFAQHQHFHHNLFGRSGLSGCGGAAPNIYFNGGARKLSPRNIDKASSEPDHHQFYIEERDSFYISINPTFLCDILFLK